MADLKLDPFVRRSRELEDENRVLREKLARLQRWADYQLQQRLRGQNHEASVALRIKELLSVDT